MFGRVAALASGLALFACSAVGVRDTPQPPYTTVAKLGEVEVRQYGPRIAADTLVTGDEVDARSTGFRRLAGYIFGGNHDGTKIAMTAPVAQDRAAPAAQSADAGGQWTIRFFMPPDNAMDRLPKPNDPQVALIAVPPETMAVLRFSGTASKAAVASHTGALVAALEGSAWRPAGAPVAWFYDPPWTLPPLRRNEVAIPVSPN